MALFLRHVALKVVDLERVEAFYTGVLGMHVAWRPDPDSTYLTANGDSLALHRASEVAEPCALDHLGFIVKQAEEVDAWAERLRAAGVQLTADPTTHRDGARSLYVRDPGGNLVQILYHPAISPTP